MINSIAGSFPHTAEPAEKMLTVSPCVPRLIKSLARTYQETLSPMNELERAGIIHATPHYLQGKCLYLIHPIKDGRAPARVHRRGSRKDRGGLPGD